MTVSTLDVLKSIGFKEDPAIMSDSPGLRIDFGNFSLEVAFTLNERLRPIVMLMGVKPTSREFSVFSRDIPREFQSLEQGIAVITYYLDRHSRGGIFKPSTPTPWLEEGRKNRHLLPWEQERV